MKPPRLRLGPGLGKTGSAAGRDSGPAAGSVVGGGTVATGTRAGFSLVEVIVALVMLTVLMLGAQALAARMIRTATTANTQVTAAQMVEDRIDFVRLDPEFDSLATRYGVTETAVPGYPGFQRTTAFTRTTTVTTNGTTDYLTMTVTVTQQQLVAPVSRTVVITTP